jgi:hypothetical protein
VCLVVADSGGGSVLSRVPSAPCAGATLTAIGPIDAPAAIDAFAYDPATATLYGVTGGTLGTIDPATGAFSPDASPRAAAPAPPDRSSSRAVTT